MTEEAETSPHSEAMRHADEGEDFRMQGDYCRALNEFRRAAELEAEAAEELDPDIQPGHGVLHRSAATLAVDANWIEKARELAESGLEASPAPALESELDELVELVTIREDDRRVTARPVPVIESLISSLRAFFPDLRIEMVDEGRICSGLPSNLSDQLQSLWLYRDIEDFEAWKFWTWDDRAFPSRIRISVESETGQRSEVRLESFHPSVDVPDFVDLTLEIFEGSVLPTDLKSRSQPRVA